MPIDQQASETIALKVLTWLVANDDLMAAFMGSTGADEADVRTSAGDPAFLGAVLDFVLMDDAWVIACADSMGMAPDALAQARMSLPGGDRVHWT